MTLYQCLLEKNPCLLAGRADTVVRVFCGLPLVLKGECKL